MQLTDPKVRITYRNTNGVGIVMGKFPPFWALSFSGFGSPENTVNTQSLFGVDGAQKTSSALNVRDMEVIMLIKAESFDDLQDLKRKAMRALNPAYAGTLIYEVLDKTYEIDVEVVKGIDEAETNTSTSQKATLQFKALDPYWHDKSEYNKLVPLSQVNNLFKFPLSITDTFKFAEMKPGEIITIENAGDAAVGGIFTMKFLAGVQNPRIFNVETQEYFGFTHTFAAGDVVTFNTVRNQKKVTYTPFGGEEQNAMSMRTVGSTFLSMSVGTNYLQVQADGGLENIVASLDYSPLVLGV